MRKSLKKLLLLSCALGTVFSTSPTNLYAQSYTATVSYYIVTADNYQLLYDGEEKEFAIGINPGYGSGSAYGPWRW